MSTVQDEEGGLHGISIRPRLTAGTDFKWTTNAISHRIIDNGSDATVPLILYPTQGSGAGQRVGRIINCYAITVAYAVTWHATVKQEARPVRVCIWSDAVAPKFGAGFNASLTNYIRIGNVQVENEDVLRAPVNENETDHITCLYDRLIPFEHKAGILDTKYPERSVTGYANFDFREDPIEMIFDQDDAIETSPVDIDFNISAWAPLLSGAAEGTLTFSTSFFYTEPTGRKRLRPQLIDRANTQPWDY